MNPIIKQLALEAGGSHYPEVNPVQLQKFAELIVRECIAQCEKNAEHEWLGSGSKLSAFNIREHFGVEL